MMMPKAAQSHQRLKDFAPAAERFCMQLQSKASIEISRLERTIIWRAAIPQMKAV
jgi:hypothetical protein